MTSDRAVVDVLRYRALDLARVRAVDLAAHRGDHGVHRPPRTAPLPTDPHQPGTPFDRRRIRTVVPATPRSISSESVSCSIRARPLAVAPPRGGRHAPKSDTSIASSSPSRLARTAKWASPGG